MVDAAYGHATGRRVRHPTLSELDINWEHTPLNSKESNLQCEPNLRRMGLVTLYHRDFRFSSKHQKRYSTPRSPTYNVSPYQQAICRFESVGTVGWPFSLCREQLQKIGRC
jgi:hypothetical protein